MKKKILKAIFFSSFGFTFGFVILVVIVIAVCGMQKQAVVMGKEDDSNTPPTTTTIDTGIYQIEGEPSIYLQTNIAWSYMPFATTNIGRAGCGLTSSAIAFEYLTETTITPPMLLADTGSTCVVGGGSSVYLYCEYAEKNLGLSHSGTYTSLDTAISDLKAGKLVFICVKGTIRNYTTDGHYMVLWKVDDAGNIYIRDPNNYSNSVIPFTYYEMQYTFTTKYFISVWKSE